MKRAFTNIGAALLLAFSTSACIQTVSVWYRQGATEQEFSQDAAACANFMPDATLSSGFSGASYLERYYERCMFARGWEMRDEAWTPALCPAAWPSTCGPKLDACPSCSK